MARSMQQSPSMHAPIVTATQNVTATKAVAYFAGEAAGREFASRMRRVALDSAVIAAYAMAVRHGRVAREQLGPYIQGWRLSEAMMLDLPRTTATSARAA